MQKALIAHHKFIHNVMGSFVQGVAGFFGTELYSDVTEIVVGTYEKAVQHYQNYQTEAGEKIAPAYPFMTFDPVLDFEPDDQAGRFSDNYANLTAVKAATLYKPLIFQDDNVLIAPVLNRYRGSFEIVIWCRSVYEMLDLKILTHQFFGGQDRIIYPVNIEGTIAIPNEFRYFNYNNPYTQETYVLDWTKNSATTELYKTINKNLFVFPYSIRPWLKLISCSDAGDKYGGDDLAENKLSISLEWETVLPTHMVLLNSFGPVSKYSFEITSSVAYINDDLYKTKIPGEIEQIIEGVDRVIINEKKLLYQITAQDKANLILNIPIQITLPHPVTDINLIKIYYKFGELVKYNRYILDADLTTINIIPFETKMILEENDILTIIIYSEIVNP